ncbi:MAG: hypothetical protein ACFFA3_14980 [Promethearchaeota archaeon]
MKSSQKNKILKDLLIIIIFIATIPITLVYMFIKDFSTFNSFIYDYLTSGNSFFFPFIKSDNIIFQFSSGHLIDIIIFINITGIVERLSYQYYMAIILKNNFYDFSTDLYPLEFKGSEEELFPLSDLTINLEECSSIAMNSNTQANCLFKKYRFRSIQLSGKSRYHFSINQMKYHRSCLHNYKCDQSKNSYSTFKELITNFLLNIYLPSKNNSISSSFNENNIQKGGIK